MINSAVDPPPTAWEAIAARLRDDDQYAGVSAKMNNFETPPPPQLWNVIEDALEEREPGKKSLVNIRRIIYRFAAIAILLAVFISGWMLINKNILKIDIAANTAGAPALQSAINKSKTENKAGRQDISAIQKQDAVENVHPGWRSANTGGSRLPGAADRTRPIKYAMVDIPNRSISLPAVSAPPILDENGNPIMDIDVLTTNSNYLVVAGPNGQLTRISSKFATAIRYLNGSNDTEEYLNKVIKDSDAWKKRFREWRSKISQSFYIPASTNFLDIAALKDLIEEKQ